MSIDSKQAAEFLRERLGVDVKQGTLIGWYRQGLVNAAKVGRRWMTTEEAIEEALHKSHIPPKTGRKRRFSREQRAAMCKMYTHGGKTLKEIAGTYGCDESYVSLVVRGKR